MLLVILRQVLPIFRTFLGDILATCLHGYLFFFRWCPLEDQLANLLVKLTKLGQGGPSGPGLQGLTNSRWACSSLCCSSSTYLGFGPRPKGPRSYLFVRLWRQRQKGKQRLPLYDFHRFFRLSWDEYWESRQTILLLCRFLVLDYRPDARGPLEVLVGIVLGELDSSTPRVSAIEI